MGNEIFYIHWSKDAEKINLKQQAYRDLYNSLDPKKQFHGKKTVRKAWIDIGTGAWSIDRHGDFGYIYYYDGNKYTIYSSNILDDAKNLGQKAAPGKHISGKNYKLSSSFSGDFVKKFGCTLKKAYGTVEEDFKIFIPKQFYYNDLNDNKNLFAIKKLNKFIYNHCSSIDFCSMYPSSACGILPDSHTAIVIEDSVYPNEEYPFAFYPDSGHICIHNELDTHDWVGNKLENYIFRNSDKFKYRQFPRCIETRTILMKASKYRQDELWEEYYNNRNIEPECKQKMVETIGKWHRKEYKREKYAHLAAVIIARSNNKMLNVANRIPKADIIQICVDGLIYKGTYALGGNMKKLGNIYQEFTDCKIAYGGSNKYIVEDKEHNIIKVKSGGCNCYDDGTLIAATEVKSLDDIDRWVRIDYIDGIEELV